MVRGSWEKLEEAFNKYIRVIQAVLLSVLAASVAYLLLLGLEIPLPYIMLSTLHKLILSSGELLALVWLYSKYFRDDKNSHRLGYFIRDLLVINAIFLLPFVKYYTVPIRTEIPIINQVRPYLIYGYIALLMATVVIFYILGNITQARLWLNSKIDFQKLQDTELERSRGDQFIEKMPSLARIPILGGFVKYLYCESTGYLIALLTLAVIGLVLRLWQLDGLPPYIDEFNHLLAARDIYQGLPLDQVEYRRSLYTVTLPVAVFFKLFDQNLWAARLPGVLVNLLAVVPLYLLCKRINKPIALIAVGLFVFSPWIIAASRNAREYAYYPLIFYGIALVMVKFYEAMPDRIVFFRDYRLLLQWKNLLYLGLLVFILYFVNSIDSFSTLKMLLVFYPVFGLLFMRKIDWRDPKNVTVSAVLFVAGVIILAAVFSSVGSRFLHLNYENRDYTFFAALFFEKPAQQWYYDRPLVSIIIFTLAILATFLWDRKKFVLPFSTLTFLSGLLAFSFIFLKGERPRYAINVEFWYMVLMAVGLFCAFMIGERIVQKKYRWIAWVVIVLCFWNVPQTLKASVYNDPGWHPITDEYHAEIAPALSFLQSKITKDDAIVTTGFVSSYEEFFSPGQFNDNVIIYNGAPDDGQIYAAMDANKNGWVVLDGYGGYYWSRPVPLRDFAYHKKQVEFLGWFGDVYILRWDGE